MDSKGDQIAKSNDPRALAARKLLPYLPWVGPAASVYVERKINDLRFERLEGLLSELAKRIPPNRDLNDFSEDSSFQAAAQYTLSSPESWKPYVFARILSFETRPISQVLRRLALDHTNQLTDFEFSIFISKYAPEHISNEMAKDIRSRIIDLHEIDPSVKGLEAVGLKKLEQLGFVKDNSDTRYGGTRITDLSKFLLEAIEI